MSKKEDSKYNFRQGDCRNIKHIVNVMNVYISKSKHN